MVVGKAHRGKGQSDSGRCDEPAVAPNETHSEHSMGVDSGNRGASGTLLITLVMKGRGRGSEVRDQGQSADLMAFVFHELSERD